VAKPDDCGCAVGDGVNLVAKYGAVTTVARQLNLDRVQFISRDWLSWRFVRAGWWRVLIAPTFSGEGVG
jgi:hypothetical protein